MKYILSCILFILLGHNASVAETTNVRASFAVTCWIAPVPFDMLPLNFLEFSDQAPTDNLNHDYEEALLRLAPNTFKDYKKYIATVKIQKAPMLLPGYKDHDTFINPPKGCVIITLIADGPKPDLLYVNKEYWDKLTIENMNFLLFNYYVQKYLRSGLAQSDYRKFSFYVAAKLTDKLGQQDKNDFLEYYGIEESPR
jgi:hypothetical protein